MEKQLMDRLFKLRHYIDRKLDSRIQESNPTPLTMVQLTALHYIVVESEKRDVFSKDVEVFLDIKSSSVASLMNYLERAGYIRRIPVEEDGRLRKLAITEKTREIQGWLCSLMDEYIESMFTGFTQEEMNSLNRLLGKMMAVSE